MKKNPSAPATVILLLVAFFTIWSHKMRSDTELAGAKPLTSVSYAKPRPHPLFAEFSGNDTKFTATVRKDLANGTAHTASDILKLMQKGKTMFDSGANVPFKFSGTEDLIVFEMPYSDQQKVRVELQNEGAGLKAIRTQMLKLQEGEYINDVKAEARVMSEEPGVTLFVTYAKDRADEDYGYGADFIAKHVRMMEFAIYRTEWELAGRPIAPQGGFP